MRKKRVTASKSTMLNNIINRAKWEMRGGKSVDEATDAVAEEFGLSKDGNIYNYVRDRLEESAPAKVTASKVDEFMEYHEDPANYHNNPDGFSKMYEILDKYGDENETVDVAFERATPEDQDKMLSLIKYKNIKPGDDGYARKLYYGALEGKLPEEMHNEDYSRQYLEGIVDAIDALFAEGWLDEQEFRTDL